MEAVTEILLKRGRDNRRLTPMAAFSFLAHLAAAILLVLMPGRLGGKREDPLRDVMSISLGGAPGPRSGGMTPMGGRAVEAVEAPPEPAKPQPVRPPVEKAPEMTLPKPGAKPIVRPPVKSSPTDARGRKPATATEARPGNSVAETSAKGLGFGLTTGGGGAVGGYLEVGSFCCPDYLATMLQLIQRNWNSKQGVPGGNVVRFTIQRDGTITNVELPQSSGYAVLDLASRRVLLVTRALPPLPQAFPNETLTVRLTFNYQP